MTKNPMTFASAVVGMLLPTLCSGEAPFFIFSTPETVIVDLRLGQNSFECRGTAIDLESFQTVYISTAPPPDFMHFETAPGNPASFRLWADHLTGANYGGYFVDVFASESPTNLIASTNVGFAIGIIPEPSSATLMVACCGIATRSRRQLSA